MVYNKLVRDKIPEIIEKQGQKPTIRIMEEEEYIQALEQKLDEEVGEFHRDKNTEELADILEVVFALAKTLDCSVDELMQVYQKKHDARGGFEQLQAETGKLFAETPLGEGAVHFPTYLAALRRYNYNGWLTIERETGANPQKDITLAVSFLKTQLELLKTADY